MKIYIVVVVYRGVVDEVEAFTDEAKANSWRDEKLRENDIPTDPTERVKYYEQNLVDLDVDILEADLELPPMQN